VEDPSVDLARGTRLGTEVATLESRSEKMLPLAVVLPEAVEAVLAVEAAG
jgi:hypothetical protein